MYTPVIVLRATSKCNMNCSYCYDRGKKLSKQGSDDEFKKQIDNMIENIRRLSAIGGNTRKVKLIIHGGEPLLIKSITYEEFLFKLNLLNNCTVSIQTNGTLLNKEYIKVFEKYNVSVGVSLDGYNEKTNCCRIYRNGKTTFNDVLSNLKMLKNSTINYSVIFTVNKTHIGKEKEIYNFIANNSITCSIRPAFPIQRNDPNVMSNDEYKTFFINLYNIWSKDNSGRVGLKQIIDLYDELSKALDKEYRTRLCCDSKGCFGKFFGLDVEGNVYGCNRSYGNAIFYYGQINKISDEEIMEKAKLFNRKRY